MSTPENYTNSNFFSWIESCVVKYLSKYAIRIRMSRKSKVKHLLDDTDSHAYNDTTKPRKKLLLRRICCLELWCCLAISATHVSNQHTLKNWDIFTSITTNFENRMAPTKKKHKQMWYRSGQLEAISVPIASQSETSSLSNINTRILTGQIPSVNVTDDVSVGSISGKKIKSEIPECLSGRSSTALSLDKQAAIFDSLLWFSFVV